MNAASKEIGQPSLNDMLEAGPNTQVIFHFAGVDNPADACSRGCTASELIRLHLWWNGPSWLQDCEPPSETPAATMTLEEMTQHDREINPAPFLITVKSDHDGLSICHPFSV